MKRRYLLIAMLFFFTNCICIAQLRVVKLWDNLVPGTETKQNEERWEDEKIVYSVYQPNLSIFIPQGGSGKTPAVIICPGGGFRRIVMEKEGYKIAKWLNQHGVACFVLKYRLVPNEALVDARRAVSFLRFYADQFNVDPSKIGVMGFSAGGFVVANLSAHYNKTIFYDKVDSISSRPDFMIGVYAFMEPRDTNKTNAMYFSPFHSLVNKNTPPTFLVHTVDDESVPVEHSVNYYTALKRNGVPVELHLYEKGKHGFALETDRGVVIRWAELCIDWLKTREILK